MHTFVIVGCIVVCLVILYWMYLGFMEGRKQAKAEGTTQEKVKPPVHPLIVGREYLVKDDEKNWHTLVYMGKTIKGKYTFYNLDNGEGVAIRPAEDKAAQLFELGDVRWLEEQSELCCPKIEEDSK